MAGGHLVMTDFLLQTIKLYSIPGLLKLRTAVHNPDREDVSGGPRQSPNLVQNPIWMTNILLTY